MMDRARILSLLALLAVTGAASAEERIQVQAGPLTLEAPVDLRGKAEALASRIEPVLPRLEDDLGATFAGPFKLYLIPQGIYSDPELEELDYGAPAWAAGYILPDQRIGAVRMREAERYPHNNAFSVVVHECVHMLLYDAGGNRFPRWFQEGVSTRETRRWGLRDTFIYSSWLVRGDLPGLDRLDQAFHRSEDGARFAYAASFDFVSWAVGQHGHDALRRVVQETGSRPFPGAWLVATGSSLAEDAAGWRHHALMRYRWVPWITSGTTLWLAITVLFLVSIVRRRARNRQIIRRWGEEEAYTP